MEVNSERDKESGRRHLGNIIVRASLRRYMTASSILMHQQPKLHVSL